ncbi:hypothetical protein [Microbispora catharanthi]|uniref:hypothetical protein n=1 Tax=Microbispora catharanthi TaxID=1712871 RepID=UPI001F1011FB|nr:hypothetical protein [Microbispora catharanthi]
METIRDPGTFRRAARRAAEPGKAIVVLKAGSSELSVRTAAAHTGALVGDDATIDAVFKDLGIIGSTRSRICSSPPAPRRRWAVWHVAPSVSGLRDRS